MQYESVGLHSEMLGSPRLRVTVAGHVREDGVTCYLLCDASGVTRARRSIDDFRRLHDCIRSDLQLGAFPVRRRLIRYPSRTWSKAIALDHYLRTVLAQAKARGHLPAPLLDFIGAPQLTTGDFNHSMEASHQLGRPDSCGSDQAEGLNTTPRFARAAATCGSDAWPWGGWCGSAWESCAVAARACASSMVAVHVPTSSARWPRSSTSIALPAAGAELTCRQAGEHARRSTITLVSQTQLYTLDKLGALFWRAWAPERVAESLRRLTVSRRSSWRGTRRDRISFMGVRRKLQRRPSTTSQLEEVAATPRAAEGVRSQHADLNRSGTQATAGRLYNGGVAGAPSSNDATVECSAPGGSNRCGGLRRWCAGPSLRGVGNRGDGGEGEGHATDEFPPSGICSISTHRDGGRGGVRLRGQGSHIFNPLGDEYITPGAVSVSQDGAVPCCGKREDAETTKACDPPIAFLDGAGVLYGAGDGNTPLSHHRWAEEVPLSRPPKAGDAPLFGCFWARARQSWGLHNGSRSPRASARAPAQLLESAGSNPPVSRGSCAELAIQREGTVQALRSALGVEGPDAAPSWLLHLLISSDWDVSVAAAKGHANLRWREARRMDAVAAVVQKRARPENWPHGGEVARCLPRKYVTTDAGVIVFMDLARVDVAAAGGLLPNHALQSFLLHEAEYVKMLLEDKV